MTTVRRWAWVAVFMPRPRGGLFYVYAVSAFSLQMATLAQHGLPLRLHVGARRLGVLAAEQRLVELDIHDVVELEGLGNVRSRQRRCIGDGRGRVGEVREL